MSHVNFTGTYPVTLQWREGATPHAPLKGYLILKEKAGQDIACVEPFVRLRVNSAKMSCLGAGL